MTRGEDPDAPESGGPKEPEPFEVRVSSPAARDLDRIPPRYGDAIVGFLFGPLADNPLRVGKELRGDLAGLHGARRGDYRVLYRILERDRVVLVVRIDHRASVYRRR